MRSLCRLTPIALSIALSFALGTALAEGEASSFDTSPGLYAAAELGLGGRPLYQQLFPKGWPTSKEFRRITLDSGEAAFADSIGAILGSGAGIPLEVSSFERNRLEDLKQNQGSKAPTGTDQMLAQRWQAFATASGLPAGTVPGDFKPVFIPYRHADPITANFDDSKLSTWKWANRQQNTGFGLDGVGFAIYANALFAEQQLANDRTLGGQPLAGRNDLDGFLALVALECATAAMKELKLQLCVTYHGAGGKPGLGAPPTSWAGVLKKGENREYYFPHGFTATVAPGHVEYAIGAAAEDLKSHLYDQAALILGLCELAKVSAPSKSGAGRFFNPDKKAAAFPESTSAEALDLAMFVARTIKELHYNSIGNGNCSSFATSDGGPADTVRPEDGGLLLVAIEQFLSLQNAKLDQLSEVQKNASVIMDKMTAFLLDVQKTGDPGQAGFFDSYNLSVQKPAETKRSLGTQGLAVRGLLAAARAANLPAYGASKKHPEAKDAAVLLLRWLDEKRWDKERRAFSDEPGKPLTTRARDGASVLGALRDMALETSDCRYLLSYKTYLSTLAARGFFLSETARSRAPRDGMKTPAQANKAPVVAPEVTIP
jgi:hypothetical protein